MGKFAGVRTSMRKKQLIHPLLGHKWCGLDWALTRSIAAPYSFRFYANAAEREKWLRAVRWAKALPRRIGENCAIDAFGGIGILAVLYGEIGFQVLAIEKNRLLAAALLINMIPQGAVGAPWRLRISDHVFARWGHIVRLGDNRDTLSKMPDSDPSVRLIDLDAYAGCAPQIKEAVRILRTGNLFVTAGDLVAGVRFKDWSYTARRYGVEFSGPREAYPEKVLFPFIEKEAASRGKSAELIDAFTFPTIARINIRIF